MKHEKLNEALSGLQDRHIEEAARYKKRKPIRWIAPIAALLAVAILVGALWRPMNSTPDTPQFSGNVQSTDWFPGLDDPQQPDTNHLVQLRYLVEDMVAAGLL